MTWEQGSSPGQLRWGLKLVHMVHMLYPLNHLLDLGIRSKMGMQEVWCCIWWTTFLWIWLFVWDLYPAEQKNTKNYVFGFLVASPRQWQLLLTREGHHPAVGKLWLDCYFLIEMQLTLSYGLVYKCPNNVAGWNRLIMQAPLNDLYHQKSPITFFLTISYNYKDSVMYHSSSTLVNC